MIDDSIAHEMVDAGWIYPIAISHLRFSFHVTRAGAEAAGVLARCRVEDVER